jgi:hypothetical protein
VKRWWLIGLGVACASAAIAQTNGSFYVSTNGNDSNPGTEAAPWRTIQHAADRVHAGAIVNVRGGLYEECVTLKASGNATAGYITFRSQPGETAILDAEHLTPTGRSAVVTIQDQSYIRVEGFEIRGYRTRARDVAPLGISVMGAGSHIELLRNDVHHIEQLFAGRDAPGRGADAFGIAVYGTDAKIPISDLIIDGNEVHHLKTGSSESLVVNGNVRNFWITHNRVHDNDNIGIDVIGFEGTAPDPAVDRARDGIVSGNTVYNITSRGNPAYGEEQSADGIYVDGGTRVIIEQNVVHDVDFGIELASEHKDRATREIIARNNLIYRNHTAGISIGGYDPNRGSTEYCSVVNNTLYDDDTAATGSGEFQTQWHLRGNSFENNIVYAGSACLVMLNKTNLTTQPSALKLDHNDYYCSSGAAASRWGTGPVQLTGFRAHVQASGSDRHSRFADPRFVDLEHEDFRLRSDSAAMAAGAVQGLPVGEQDLGGSARLRGGTIDDGAYQRP